MNRTGGLGSLRHRVWWQFTGVVQVWAAGGASPRTDPVGAFRALKRPLLQLKKLV